jgi:hypothetical protein
MGTKAVVYDGYYLDEYLEDGPNTFDRACICVFKSDTLTELSQEEIDEIKGELL